METTSITPGTRVWTKEGVRGKVVLPDEEDPPDGLFTVEYVNGRRVRTPVSTRHPFTGEPA